MKIDMTNEPFLNYLASKFLQDYHGDKEHYESAFDGWLENLDNGELIEYGNKSIREITLRIKGANGAPAHVLDEIVNEYL